MHGRCLSLLTVCLVSIFLHFSAAGPFWTSAKNTHFCFWTSSISNGQTHYMFLRQTTVGKERSFVLFDSIWNKENSLVECITSNNHDVIKSFSSKCWKARDGPFSDVPDRRFNIGTLLEPDGPCVAVRRLPDLRVPVRRSRDVQSMDRGTVSQNMGGSSDTLKRSKRAWMIPGTLWCGSGNKASNFSDLGLFEETDNCCRDHDHCEQTIASFEFSHGIFNTNFFTLSHCDCDNKFRRCLHSANDRMSDMVGYGYFNVLKMRCFEFSQRTKCAEWTWWGMCKHSKMITYALLREAIDYNSTFSVLEDGSELDLSLYNTVSFGDLTVTNDLLMSSDIVTKDASQKHSSVSVPKWLSVTVNRSQQPELHGKTRPIHTTDSSKTETTDSSERKPTDSPLIITDLEQKQTPDSLKSEITYPLLTQTDSHMRQTTNASHANLTDSSSLETIQPSNLDSSKTVARDSTNPEMTDSSTYDTTEATDIPNPATTDSTHPVSTVTDSTKVQTTDSPNTRITDLQTTDTTDLLKTQTRDLTKPKITDLKKAETTDTTQINLTGSTKTQTDSLKPQTADSTEPQTTDSTTDSLKLQTTDSPEPQTQKPQTTDSPKTRLHPETNTKQKGKLDTCEGYKDLDSCHYQIAALGEKFGLHNVENTTMYHCNCTARLAKELAEEDKVDKVHFWLLDFVSRSCFIRPQNCTKTESCSSSSSSSSNDAPLIERWSNGAAVWRHLAAPRRKNKRFNNKRSKRKDSPIRLYKKCLRMYSNTGHYT